eukprot:TRINITY_DN50092_c0_g1_i1.p1 TRINITY_DN50092_c0_g1~~TRINITY_DN50092_c0_g1_i1.p1  ORF type:complete len:924 (-),score=164.28 TRINITY_DN50092_c0_g1_i1:119-2890(-)
MAFSFFSTSAPVQETRNEADEAYRPLPDEHNDPTRPVELSELTQLRDLAAVEPPDSWALVVDDSELHLKVHHHHMEDDSAKTWERGRAECRFAAPVEKILQVMSDPQVRSQWDDLVGADMTVLRARGHQFHAFSFPGMYRLGAKQFLVWSKVQPFDQSGAPCTAGSGAWSYASVWRPADVTWDGLPEKGPDRDMRLVTGFVAERAHDAPKTHSRIVFFISTDYVASMATRIVATMLPQLIPMFSSKYAQRVHEMLAADSVESAEKKSALLDVAQADSGSGSKRVVRLNVSNRHSPAEEEVSATGEHQAADTSAAERERAEREVTDRQAVDRVPAERRELEREREEAERQAAERKAAEREAVEREATERQAAKRKAAEREAAEREAQERQIAERNAAERKRAEREATERQAAERKETQRQAAERQALDSSAGERQAAERKEEKGRAVGSLAARERDAAEKGGIPAATERHAFAGAAKNRANSPPVEEKTQAVARREIQAAEVVASKTKKVVIGGDNRRREDAWVGSDGATLEEVLAVARAALDGGHGGGSRDGGAKKQTVNSNVDETEEMVRRVLAEAEAALRHTKAGPADRGHPRFGGAPTVSPADDYIDAVGTPRAWAQIQGTRASSDGKSSTVDLLASSHALLNKLDQQASTRKASATASRGDSTRDSDSYSLATGSVSPRGFPSFALSTPSASSRDSGTKKTTVVSASSRGVGFDEGGTEAASPRGVKAYVGGDGGGRLGGQIGGRSPRTVPWRPVAEVAQPSLDTAPIAEIVRANIAPRRTVLEASSRRPAASFAPAATKSLPEDPKVRTQLCEEIDLRLANAARWRQVEERQDLGFPSGKEPDPAQFRAPTSTEERLRGVVANRAGAAPGREKIPLFSEKLELPRRTPLGTRGTDVWADSLVGGMAAQTCLPPPWVRG